MNIIEYKINETKLQKLIDKAYERSLTDLFFVMNDETSTMLEAHCCEHYRCEHILHKCHNSEIDTYYCGIKIVIDNDLELGEVRLYGYEEKIATVIKIYATGETDIYTDRKEKVLVRID